MIVKFVRWMFGLCRHKWGKWEISGTRGRAQSRRCEKCGLYQEDTINRPL